jgi:hypothetical protein
MALIKLLGIVFYWLKREIERNFDLGVVAWFCFYFDSRWPSFSEFYMGWQRAATDQNI